VIALASGEGSPFAIETEIVRRLSEFALLVAVLGAGLKIDRRFSLRKWASAWRLLGPVMLVSIFAVAGTAHFLLGASIGIAVLIGAILAPTDPVLAADYAAGPPGTGEEGELKFALTSEAGLNDGFAFPFVVLGVLLMQQDVNTAGILRWIGIDLLWDIVAGLAIGTTVGWVLAKVNIWLPEKMRLSASNSGLVAVGLAFLSYGLALFAHGNGFVAVFAEAVALRNLIKGVEYSRTLNHMADQFERLAMILVLTVLGLSVTRGLFVDVGWPEIGFAAVILLVIRPAAVAIGFIGSPEDRWTRATLGYFGIRGIASIYYGAHVARDLSAADAHRIVSIVGIVVVGSVLLYGTTAHFVGRVLGGPDAFEK
jgi:NhaP-type Na+/H+ or K+/H+ antiporter